jgi:hypothetical protein
MLTGAVILLQDVVKILHGSMAAVFLQRSFGFELHDSRWVSTSLATYSAHGSPFVWRAVGWAYRFDVDDDSRLAVG